MKQTIGTVRVRILQAAACASMAVMSATALAQTAVVTYVLDDVWLLPDISHPSQSAQQMTGSFEWTYEVGDFENGTAQLLELTAPWFNPALQDLDITVDLMSIEITYNGNVHDLGFDVTLDLLEPLSPNQPAAIDPASMFDIQQGISHKGHVVSGLIVPMPIDCPADINGDGVVDAADLAMLLGSWGPCPGCPVDFDGDDDVDAADLANLLGAWGPCP